MGKIKCKLWMTLLVAHAAGLFPAMAGAQEVVERKAHAAVRAQGGFAIPDKKRPGQPIVIVTFNVFLTSVDFTDEQLGKLVPVLAKLKQLESLDLGGTSISNAGLKHVAKLKQLRTLVLSDGITVAGFKELARLERLEALFMGHRKMTGVGLRHLAGLKNLKWLELFEMSFTEAGMKELGDLKRLQRLGLRGATFTEADMKELAGLENLTRLNLEDTNVTDVGLKQLTTLHKLRKLRLYNTRVTVAGINELQRTLSRCRIEITAASEGSP